MTDTHINEKDKPFYDRIVTSAKIGIDYWRPGDIREAQHIIGSEEYFDLSKSISGSKICKLFYKAVLRGDLPLEYIAKLSNKHCVYTNAV